MATKFTIPAGYSRKFVLEVKLPPSCESLAERLVTDLVGNRLWIIGREVLAETVELISVQRTGIPDVVLMRMFSGVSTGALSRQKSLNILLDFPAHEN